MSNDNNHDVVVAERAEEEEGEPRSTPVDAFLTLMAPDGTWKFPISTESFNAIFHSEATANAIEQADLQDSCHQKVECVVCFDEKPMDQVERLPCKSHWVCRQGCLPEYFEKAVNFQALYPPKCCKKTILIINFEHVLSANLMIRYTEKTWEYHTDPRLRRYCAKDNTFLPPHTYEDHVANKEITIAQCTSCLHSTCILCTKFVESPRFTHDCKPKKLETNKEYSKENRFK